MMVKKQSKKTFFSSPRMRGLNPQQRQAAWLQRMAAQRNRSGYPLPRIPRGPQRATINRPPRARRAIIRNRRPTMDKAMAPLYGGSSIQTGRQMGARTNRPLRGVNNRGVRMSRCASLYAVGVVNPFSFFDGSLCGANKMMGINELCPELPCIPEGQAKSRKVKVFVRGTFSTFTDGTGIVAFAPNRLANNNLITNDYAPPLFLTNATSSASGGFPTMDSNAVVSTGVTGYNSNSDYTTTALAGGVSTRLVGAGVRIRYAGSELNRGGIVHCVETPNHLTLSGGTVATISQYESYFRVPVTREWTTLVYTPVAGYEKQFSADPSAAFSPNWNHYMGMIIVSSVASLFEYEAVGLFEAFGANVRDLTYSESDITGAQLVQNVIRPETQLIRNEQGPAGVFKLIKEGAEMLTSIAPGVVATGKMIASALL